MKGFSLVVMALALIIWFVVPPHSAAASPGFQSSPAVGTAFLRQAAGPLVALNPNVGGQQRGTVGTSVLGSQQPGEICSANSPGQCSALNVGDRCSAENDQFVGCSVFRLNANEPPGGACSALAAHGICSVLPTSAPPVNQSVCSAGDLVDGQGALQCSAVTGAVRLQCTVKGIAGSSICSTLGINDSCSVLNLGSNNRSFCSTKIGVAGAVAKACSTLGLNAPPGQQQCSIVAGGAGVCTAFGQAGVNSCSALAGGHCSVIGGPSGTHCAQ